MDAEEFDSFYAASFRRLVAQVYAMTGDRDKAQACVQEAFVRAWSHRRQLEKAHAPEAWVRTTAYRLAVSRWRRTVRASGAGASQHRRHEDGSTSDDVSLMAALERLPGAHRRAIVLHHMCDLSVPAVAAEVGVPEGTVKSRLSRGRSALLSLLGEEPSRLTEGTLHV